MRQGDPTFLIWFAQLDRETESAKKPVTDDVPVFPGWMSIFSILSAVSANETDLGFLLVEGFGLIAVT